MHNTLSDDECHVWHISLESDEHDINALSSLLSPSEHERLHQYQFDKDQRRFCISRAYLRKILSTYTGIEPEAVEFRYTDHKKPFVDQDIEFNISHSATDVVIAIAKHPVGIDIETCSAQPEALNIAKRFFTPNEYNHLATLPPEKVSHCFFHLWTQKEAIVKAIGKGVFHDLKNVEVSPEPPSKLLSLKNDSETVNDWSIFTIPIPRENTFCMCAVKGAVKKPVMMAF